MNKLEQAKRIVQKHEEEVRAKKKAWLDEWIKDKVGKTFVYRNNSYGSSSELSWDVFKIVIKPMGEASALVESWELIDPKKGTFKITSNVDYVYEWNLDEGKTKSWNGYLPCSLKEFEENKQKILNYIPQKESTT